MVRITEADFVLCEVHKEVLTRINPFGRTWVKDQFLTGVLRTQRRLKKKKRIYGLTGIKTLIPKQRRLTTNIIYTQKKTTTYIRCNQT